MADGPQHHVLFIEQRSNAAFHGVVCSHQAADIVRAFGRDLAIGVAGIGKAFQPPRQGCQRPCDAAKYQRHRTKDHGIDQQGLGDQRLHHQPLGRRDQHPRDDPARALLLADGGDQHFIGSRAVVPYHHPAGHAPLRDRINYDRSAQNHQIDEGNVLIGQDFVEFGFTALVSVLAAAHRSGLIHFDARAAKCAIAKPGVAPVSLGPARRAKGGRQSHCCCLHQCGFAPVMLGAIEQSGGDRLPQHQRQRQREQHLPFETARPEIFHHEIGRAAIKAARWPGGAPPSPAYSRRPTPSGSAAGYGCRAQSCGAGG